MDRILCPPPTHVLSPADWRIEAEGLVRAHQGVPQAAVPRRGDPSAHPVRPPARRVSGRCHALWWPRREPGPTAAFGCTATSADSVHRPASPRPPWARVMLSVGSWAILWVGCYASWSGVARCQIASAPGSCRQTIVISPWNTWFTPRAVTFHAQPISVGIGW